MKILDFGSLNYDFVYSVDHMVLPGETISAVQMETFCGGKGLNQAIALRRAGADVYFAGKVGEDGALLLQECEKNGIYTRYIDRTEGKCGHAIIQLDRHSQNSILLFGGANQRQTREHVDRVLSEFCQKDILLLQNEINEIEYLLQTGYERGLLIALNPSPFNERVMQFDLQKVHIFLMNEIEGASLTGATEPELVLDQMAERYPDAITLLTVGAKGAYCLAEGIKYYQRAYKVSTVDTTAAGDTFTGYFLAGIAACLPIQYVLEFAACAAAIAVSRKGAVPSIPNRAEVIEHLRYE